MAGPLSDRIARAWDRFRFLTHLGSRFVYQPLGAGENWVPPPSGADFRDLMLTTVRGVAIHAWWCPVPGATGTMLLAHGNAANLSSRGPSVVRLQQGLGLSVLIFDYPGYGKSSGFPSERGCYESAEACFRWLTTEAGFSPEQIVLFGESLGGGVAVELARTLPHRALILVRTFTSVPAVASRWLGSRLARWYMRDRFENLAKIGHLTRPVLIAHGDLDQLIPFPHGEALFAAASQPKRFVRLVGCGHNTYLPDEFYAAVREFLASVD